MIILVVDDEPQIRKLLITGLGGYGYEVLAASNATEALALAAQRRPDAVVLDVNLGQGPDGLEVCRRLREWSAVPIVVLSARGREGDKIEALDAGADDYVTKPFAIGELTARLRAALRRSARPQGDEQAVVTTGSLAIDLGRRRVTLAGADVKLTPIEYRLLATLARHAGRVLTHAALLREVWGPGSTTQHHYLRVFMAQLRRKLEADSSRPQLLLTEPGVGYRLRDPEG